MTGEVQIADHNHKKGKNPSDSSERRVFLFGGYIICFFQNE